MLLVVLLPLALAAPDKSEKVSKATDSYNSPVGTSYTVPLTAQYSAPVSKDRVPYSVSASDLERADLSVSSSLTAPVYTGAYEPRVSTYTDYTVQQVAEARDGGGHHHDHHEHHEHPAEHGAEAAAAPAAPEPAYQAPVSQGNLYYYYYPVQAEPLVEKSDASSDELDPLVLVLLPITLLVGILAVLSVLNVSLTGRAGSGRAFPAPRENPLNDAFGSFDQLKIQVDRLLERYYHALESESCMDRVVCELGTKAKDLSGKNMLMTALDWIIPTHMSSKISTFKAAVNEGYEVHECKAKFYCDSHKVIQARRK